MWNGLEFSHSLLLHHILPQKLLHELDFTMDLSSPWISSDMELHGKENFENFVGAADWYRNTTEWYTPSKALKTEATHGTERAN